MAQSSKVAKHYGALLLGDAETVTSNQTISTTGVTVMDSSSAAITALVLPVPKEAGKLKIIQQIGSGTNACTVTSLFRTGASTDTTSAAFNAADESLILVSTGTRWQVLLNTGSVSLS